MTFKAGDKVRYKDGARNREWHGWEGVVNWSQGSTTSAKTTKGSIPGKEVNMTTDNLELIELELIEQSFTYEDIQVGDRIRRTLTRDTGTTEVREGTVVSKAGGLAVDRDGPLSYILAYDSDGHPDKKLVVLELLDRPKPKHWTETKPVGSVAVILDGNFTKTLTKTSEFGWNVRYAIDGYTYKDSNKAIQARTADLDEAKLTWIK